MKKYVLTFNGGNERLHVEALKAAIKAAEAVNKAPVYRAWLEDIDSSAVSRRSGALTDGKDSQ